MSTQWRADDPPGAGQWRGRRIQVAGVPASPPARSGTQAVPTLRIDRRTALAIVTRSPRADAAAIRDVGLEPLLLDPVGDTAVRATIASRGDTAGRPPVVIGDADAWAANWTIAASMREGATVVVHGGPREYRVFAPGPALPPLLDDPVDQCWVLTPGEGARRSRWPLQADN